MVITPLELFALLLAAYLCGMARSLSWVAKQPIVTARGWAK